MCDINQRIAQNLKELRKNRQLTLEELAEKSGVSKSMLGEIERGRTNPTVAVLWKIAGALKIPLTGLINEAVSPYTVVRGSGRPILSQENGSEIATVFPYYDPHRLEVFSLKIAPGSKLGNTGHLKGVEEYLFVLKGSVNVGVNGETIGLNPGDAIRFAADANHEIGNFAETDAEMINVIVYQSPAGVGAER